MMKCILVACLLISFNVSADINNTKVSEFSNDCAALFQLMGSASIFNQDYKPASDNISNLALLMGDVSALNYQTDITMGELEKRRLIAGDKILIKYANNKDKIINLYARCDKLREKIAVSYLNSGDDAAAGIRKLTSLKIPSNNITMGVDKSLLINNWLNSSLGELNRRRVTLTEFVDAYTSLDEKKIGAVNKKLGID